jgi:phospholipid transport system substrate-binding protein
MIKALATWLLMAAALAPATPLSFVERSVGDLVSIVHHLAGRNSVAVEKQCAALRRASAHLFDFKESGRRMLAGHWEDRSPKERAEFVRLLGDLLQATYVERMRQWASARIVYLSESVDRDWAEVRTEVVRERESTTAVEYRLARGDRGWAAYDVELDGLSLLEAYREQFDEIVRTESFSRLLQRMRAMRKGQESIVVSGCPVRAA